MKKSTSLLLPALLLLLAVSAHADTLTLKDGTVLTGKYLGGNADTVRFETSAGLQIIDMAQVKSMNVAPPAAAPAPVPAPAPAPAPVAAPAAVTSVTLPAGTDLMVQMQQSVSSRSADGTNFTTQLAYDVVANGVVALKAGTVIYGKVQSATQAGRLRGQSTLDIRLAQMLVNNSPIPIMTTSYAEAGQKEGRQTVKAAGVGAIIGNNANGGGHGGGGAAWGVAAAGLKPGETLTVPQGALLEFTLTQPVTVPVSH